MVKKVNLLLVCGVFTLLTTPSERKGGMLESAGVFCRSIMLLADLFYWFAGV